MASFGHHDRRNIIYVSESVTSLLEHLPVSMNTLHLFKWNYSKISNFVKYYYNLNNSFSSIYILKCVYSWDGESWFFSSYYSKSF